MKVGPVDVEVKVDYSIKVISRSEKLVIISIIPLTINSPKAWIDRENGGELVGLYGRKDIILEYNGRNVVYGKSNCFYMSKMVINNFSFKLFFYMTKDSTQCAVHISNVELQVFDVVEPEYVGNEEIILNKPDPNDGSRELILQFKLKEIPFSLIIVNYMNISSSNNTLKSRNSSTIHPLGFKISEIHQASSCGKKFRISPILFFPYNFITPEELSSYNSTDKGTYENHTWKVKKNGNNVKVDIHKVDEA